MNKVDIGRVLAVAKQRAGDFVGAVKDTAQEFTWDLQDAAQAGFGVPKLISSAASLSVAVVAATGTASIMLDGAGKVFGKRECKDCNGWEGLRCTMCSGKGTVKYIVSDFGLAEGENETVENIAAAVVAGRAKVDYVPASAGAGLPLPAQECPTCEGTGVMKCSTCKGEAWKPKISFDNVMDVPWKGWHVYRKVKPPTEVLLMVDFQRVVAQVSSRNWQAPTLKSSNTVETTRDRMMADPETAKWEMFERPALESGIEYDEDVKAKMWWKYKDDRRYDEVREKVERRQPGWESLQEALFNIDPERAKYDPIIVQNVPFYKAGLQLEAEVDQMQPPPRPANWGGMKRPLSEADWSKDDLKNSQKKEEMTTLLNAQEELFGALLDQAWEREWREQQMKAMSQAKIETYLKVKEEEFKNPRPSADATQEEGKGKSAPSTYERDNRAAAKAGGNKKQSADDKKKRERQERSERLQRQAAEREAALAKAKAARERRS